MHPPAHLPLGCTKATRLTSNAWVRGLLLVSLLCAGSGCKICRWNRNEQDLVAVRQLALRGAEAMQRGNADEAERCFQDAITKHPQDERCYVLLAELRRKQGRSVESTENLEKAVSLSGGDPHLLVELGEQFYEQDELAAAMECVRKALRQDATSSPAWVLHARLLREERKGAESIVAYHRALQIDPNQYSVAMELAEVYLQEGRLERCLSTLDSRACVTADAVFSGEPEYLRGLAFARMERHGDATTALAEAERKGIRSPELYFQLARSHHLSGSPASARLALGEAQKLSPEDGRFAQLAAAIDAPERSVATRPRKN